MTRTARRKTSRPSMLDVAAEVGSTGAAERAVGAEVPAQELARSVDRLEHDGAGAVGEEDGGAAVLPVGDRRQGLGADEQDALRAGGEQAVGGDEARRRSRSRRR